MITGNFSEDCLLQYQSLLAASLQTETDDFSEVTYDFTRCVRPDGSFYGSRGECQQPNKPAPQSPGSPMSTADRSAYLAGGGNAAGLKGKTIKEIIEQGNANLARMDQSKGVQNPTLRSEAEANRAGKPLSARELAAYKAGGGDAAAKKKIGGIDQVIDQGNANLARMDQSRGRKAANAPTPTQRQAPTSNPQSNASGLTAAQRSAYAAGGGNAAAMKGKSIDEVIAQGKKNLDRMDQGRGRKAVNAPTPTQRPGTSGPSGSPNANAGRKLTAAERSAYAAGGGNAAGMKGLSTEQIIAQGKKNLDRMDQGRGRKAVNAPTPTQKPARRPAGGSAGNKLSTSERSAYAAGGGNAAGMRGLSTKQIMEQGRKNLKRMDQGRGRK